MSEIKFTQEERDALAQELKVYLADEHDLELGQFDAEFMLDFVSKQLGPYFYNKGLHDARAVLQAKLEQVEDALYEIEQPVSTSR